MSRTPLFSALRRSVRLAASANRRNAPPIDELIEMHADFLSRRRFLRSSAAAGALFAIGCGKKTESPVPLPGPAYSGPKIAIVGAGVAGLNCAYKLQKAGIRADIYEASSRTGGRMFTATDLLAPGITTELGGEFIDSDHEEMLALVKEFGLGMLDMQDDSGVVNEAYFFNGRHYTEREVVNAFRPLAAKIAEDYDAMGEVVDFETEGGGKVYDMLSISEYFDRIGARGWIRELLEVAYVTEYGLEAAEQSSLNFIFMIGTDLEEGRFMVFGESDERYKVIGGNQRVVDELANRVKDQIHVKHRLEAVKPRGTGFTLTFNADGAAKDVEADYVVLALPFTLLREVAISVELPKFKKKAIAELGYGTNAKVLAAVNRRVWRDKKHSGNIFSDEPFQLAWDNSRLQPGQAGGVTFYSGGIPGMRAGEETAEFQVNRLMPGFEKAFPGVAGAYAEKASRMHWPTHPFTKASYSCYRPGQWTTIAGAEGRPVGNLFFAGEHCSYDFQGFMNGGAQSGKDTAEAIVAAATAVEEKAA